MDRCYGGSGNLSHEKGGRGIKSIWQEEGRPVLETAFIAGTMRTDLIIYKMIHRKQNGAAECRHYYWQE